MASFQQHLVIIVNKIRYQLAKLYSAVVHTHVNTCVFNGNTHCTNQNNITRKVMVSYLVKKLALNV